MSVKTEGNHAAEFLLSEANGYRSRETVTVKHDGKLCAGTVLRLDGNDYKPLAVDSGTPDSLEGDAVAVLYDNVEATTSGVDAVVIARDAEVDASRLSYSEAVHNSDDTGDLIAEAATDLADVGILVR